jgi:TolB-like protein
MLVPPAALFTLLFAAAIHERFAPNDATAGTNAVVSGPVLVGGFENFTGDSTLDIIGPLVADWITQGLARTGVVTVARHSQELWDTRTHGPRDGPRAWADLGRAAGVRIVIHGSYGRAGDSIRMQAVMADPKSGEVIQAIDPVTAPLADRMSLADQLRQRVTSVMAARMNPDLTHWITDAGQPARFTSYLEYAEGMTAFADSRWEDAKVHFFRSAAEDSSYTLPLLWAVFALSNNGEDGRSDSLVNALNRRRATMAPMDRAIHDYERAGYDNHALFEAARRLVEMAPGSEFQWKLADAAREIGRPHEAIRLLKQLDPEKSWVRSMGYWFLLADLELLVGDYDAAREANRRDAAGGWGMQQLEEEASIAAAAGDAAELRRLLVRMEADPEVTTSHGLVDGRAAWSGARALRARGDSADARQIDEWALAFLDTAALVRQARKDPNAIFFINFHRAGMLYDLGRLAESQLLFEQMDSMTTTHGEIDQHVVARNQRRNVHALGYLADIALRRGDRGAVRRYRERIMASPKTTDGAERYMLGRIAALEGRNEDAVTLLAVLLQTNAVWMKDYRIDPDLEGLRRYRPFTDLLVFRQ